MGERYRATLEQKIRELGGGNLRVFINADGVNPHYKQHLEDTFRDAGVRFVSSRAEANFVFDGDCEPNYLPGQIVAFFTDGNLAFAGGVLFYPVVPIPRRIRFWFVRPFWPFLPPT